MNQKIPNIFHLLYENIDDDDLNITFFLSIKSIIKINNPHNIYFYYYKLPSGIIWDKIKEDLILKKIEIHIKYIDNLKDFFKKYKYTIIYKNLIENGGIYLDINSICIKSFTELLKYSFVKSINNEIICSEKNSQMACKYFQKYTNNRNFNEIYGTNNFLLKCDFSKFNINDIVFKEITDYSFSEYFILIKNYYFIPLSNNLNGINLYDVLNKITIYSLLVKNALSYNFNNINFINKHKFNLINNIDTIYWINLDESINRKENMLLLLKNFNIKNIKISAINGNLEEDINKKYFYNENNNYPIYNNKEYAILLSHLITIETFININIDDLKYGYAMICEDDLSLDFINYWNKDLKTIINEAPEDWDIIMLGYFSLNINNNQLYKKWNNEWSAISYLINHKSMQKIKDFKKDNKWICKEDDLMVSDNYIFSKFNTYVYKYPYFTFPDNNDSTFHLDHLQYHEIYKKCNYLTLNNIYDEYIL